MEKEALQKLIIEAAQFRHACKQFDKTKKIPEDIFDTILKAGVLSPSSLGIEPWQFHVIQNKEFRNKLKPVTWGANGQLSGREGQLETASHFVLISTFKESRLTPDSPYISTFFKEVKQMPDEMIQGYTSVMKTFIQDDLKLTGKEIETWAQKQAYIPLGNMMNTAAMLGVDSCPIEGFSIDAVEAIMKEEGIDTSVLRPTVMIAFGYRDEEPNREKTRRAQEDVVTWI